MTLMSSSWALLVLRGASLNDLAVVVDSLLGLGFQRAVPGGDHPLDCQMLPYLPA